MRPATAPADDDTRVRDLMDSSAKAIREKDIGALMSHYAPEIVTFDLMLELQVKGVAAYRKNFESWFGSVKGPIDYDVAELTISKSDDLALCHYLAHVRSTRTNGEKNDYWVRVTSGCRKTGGQWKIAHEHVSIPLTMENMRDALSPQS
jgi:ketosteroid isomerase-like protein